MAQHLSKNQNMKFELVFFKYILFFQPFIDIRFRSSH